MSELFDKIYQVFIDDEDEIYVGTAERLTKTIEQVCIQAQIDLLNENKDRLEKQSKSLKDLINEKSGSMNNARLEGKRSGIKIAIENLRQDIQELKSQL